MKGRALRIEVEHEPRRVVLHVRDERRKAGFSLSLDAGASAALTLLLRPIPYDAADPPPAAQVEVRGDLTLCRKRHANTAKKHE